MIYSTSKCMVIGFEDSKGGIKLIPHHSSIYAEKDKAFKLPKLYFTNNDIFGCGLVFPPNNKINKEFPYIFFTQNGKQIGKGILSKDNLGSYKPFVHLVYCSIEANFGNDLKTKPFKYDISNHFILKEFY
uniref:Uncharacterized protein n=1 Tax=Meloidogyne enterolobii TaxID=390850 RepID=A0A6V7VGU9_MELEN|nr:unnamed protein product [Meloidogyne enterolobii]